MHWVWEDTTKLLLTLSVTIAFGYVRRHSFFISFFLTDAYWIVCESESHIRLFATPWTIQSMEFSRSKYWSGKPFPSPGDLPNPGIKFRTPTLQADSLSAEPQGKPLVCGTVCGWYDVWGKENRKEGKEGGANHILKQNKQKSKGDRLNKCDSSVIQSCPTLCNPMNRSTPGLPVHHQLPEFTQTHVHWVSDAIQPSHPLSSLSLPALNLPQHQGLFQWVSSLHQVARVLEFQLQHQSFQWTTRTELL